MIKTKFNKWLKKREIKAIFENSYCLIIDKHQRVIHKITPEKLKITAEKLSWQGQQDVCVFKTDIEVDFTGHPSFNLLKTDVIVIDKIQIQHDVYGVICMVPTDVEHKVLEGDILQLNLIITCSF